MIALLLASTLLASSVDPDSWVDPYRLAQAAQAPAPTQTTPAQDRPMMHICAESVPGFKGRKCVDIYPDNALICAPLDGSPDILCTPIDPDDDTVLPFMPVDVPS